jgi:hypothetical protein
VFLPGYAANYPLASPAQLRIVTAACSRKTNPSNTLLGLQLSSLLNFLPMVAALPDSEHSHALPCAICEKPCDSETCKADWNGLAVHEECLAEKLARQKLSKS